MDKLDPQSTQPLYKQLYNLILQSIRDGTFRPGDKIPSEDTLHDRFGISRVTVRKALQLLVDHEILLKIHGKGTFIAEGRFSDAGLRGGSFTAFSLQMNTSPSTHIISRIIEPPKRRIADKLGIKTGEDIIHIKRLRLLDNKPCILEHDYCPRNLDFLMDTDLENLSLFSLIREKLGLIPACFEDSFDVGYASRSDAALLNCEAGTALLRVDQYISSKDSRILYY